MISASEVKKLRDQTGAPMMKVKEALGAAKGDIARAIEILRQKGAEVAAEKAGRSAKEGVIASYIHSNDKIGVLVELNCETDFVARNPDFQQLGKDIAMQIAAMRPLVVKPADISPATLASEKKIYLEQLKDSPKPEPIKAKIVAGKLKKFAGEQSLLKQKFIKDDKITVETLVTDLVGRLKENIQIKRFVRFEVGKK